MRCIFCKKDSLDSKSIEHIMPESLGNVNHILQPGVVCDECNNYFARKVEAPFINSPQIKSLRFLQEIPNKKGYYIPQRGLAIGKENRSGVTIYKGTPVHKKDNNSERIAIVEFDDSIITEGSIIFPGVSDKDYYEMNDRVVSRFIAKIAIECIASRLVDCEPNELDEMINETALDPLRNYARYGSGGIWPYYIRRIYDSESRIENADGSFDQIVWESDFLFIPSEESSIHPDQYACYPFFILALFGLEYTIYIGSNDDDVFELYWKWLEDHNWVSPLYCENKDIIPWLV